MRRAIFLVTVALFFPGGTQAQIAEPIRPPEIVSPPTAIAPTVQPLPMTPTLILPQTPALTPAPAPSVPVQVVPPPPAAAEGDAPDGSDSCDCYVTDYEPVYDNGVLIGSNPVRRFTGKSPQCCPDH